MEKKSRFRIYSFIAIGLLLILTNSCNKEEEAVIEYGSVSDIEGNTYKTVKIGNQWWMAENLKTTRYRNGEAIENITVDTLWAKLTTGAYCWYDNKEDYKNTYGALYNWFAVNDSRQIAPAGWHVPTNEEWSTMVTFLGSKEANDINSTEFVAGGKLKEAGTTHWLSPNYGATNESGFTGLPGGLRYGSLYQPIIGAGTFCCIREGGVWWSATEDASDNRYAWEWDLSYLWEQIRSFGYIDKKEGNSVRCVKD